MMGQIKDEYEKLIPIATPKREENVNSPPYLKIKDEFEMKKENHQ